MYWVFLRPFFYDVLKHFFEDFNLRNKFSIEYFFVEDKKLDLLKKKNFEKIKEPYRIWDLFWTPPNGPFFCQKIKKIYQTVGN